MSDQIYLIYVVCGSTENAMIIGSTLVNENLVACANINTGTKSFYKWEGELQLDEEVTLFLKTTEAKLSQAIDRLRVLHTYDIPCITAWPIERGDPAFLKWIKDRLSGAED